MVDARPRRTRGRQAGRDHHRARHRGAAGRKHQFHACGHLLNMHHGIAHQADARTGPRDLAGHRLDEVLAEQHAGREVVPGELAGPMRVKPALEGPMVIRERTHARHGHVEEVPMVAAAVGDARPRQRTALDHREPPAGQRAAEVDERHEAAETATHDGDVGVGGDHVGPRGKLGCSAGHRCGRCRRCEVEPCVRACANPRPVPRRRCDRRCARPRIRPPHPRAAGGRCGWRR